MPRRIQKALQLLIGVLIGAVILAVLVGIYQITHSGWLVAGSLVLLIICMAIASDN